MGNKKSKIYTTNNQQPTTNNQQPTGLDQLIFKSFYNIPKSKSFPTIKKKNHFIKKNNSFSYSRKRYKTIYNKDSFYESIQNTSLNRDISNKIIKLQYLLEFGSKEEKIKQIFFQEKID